MPAPSPRTEPSIEVGSLCGAVAVRVGDRRLSSWVHIDTAAIPDGRDIMRLMQRDDQFSITVGTIELMTNQDRASEQALATLTCALLHDRPNARILIGGLGMGFTLRSALGALGPEASIVVSELMPAVVDWARGPLSHLFEGCLDDPRVELRVADVSAAIQSGAARYDAILLDVDNGPQGLTQLRNNRLYDVMGVRRARYALRPGGILAVWSGAPNRKFKARLKNCGFEVDERRIPAQGVNTRPHVLWLATRPDGAVW